MIRPLSLLALSCALAACSNPPAESDGANTRDATAIRPLDDAPQDTKLTVYNDGYDMLTASQQPNPNMAGYALVERPLRFPLKNGANTIATEGVSPSMDIEAATLQAQRNDVRVVSQRHIAALAGTRNVLSAAIGQKVSVQYSAGGSQQTDEGTLIAASDGLTLALDNGRIKVIRSYDSFDLVDSKGVLPQRASLRWTVNADKGGDTDFTLSYPMAGLAWRAEYLARLSKGDECRLSLDGAALVANRSGLTFKSAKLSLVAGDPNRVRRSGREFYGEQVAMAVAAAPAPMMADAAGEGTARLQQRAAGEYHAYDLPGTVRIDQGATERLSLFPTIPAAQCERSYVLEADNANWEPPQPLIDRNFNGATGDLPVISRVVLHNAREAGLGLPLPAGRVRLFDEGDFLGEASLEHMPAGSEIKLEPGKVFDLTAKRESTEFRLDKAGQTMTESFSIELKNAKKNAVNIRVIEALPRWSDWEIVSSSVPSKRKDARHAEFDVPVPAEGETRLTYTVRYRWPKDLKL